MMRSLLIPALLLFIVIPAAAQRYDRTWSGSGADASRIYRVVVDRDGSVIVAGTFFNRLDFRNAIDGGSDTVASRGGEEIFIAKIAANGSYLWTRRIGGPSTDNVTALVTDSAGNIYVAGQVNGSRVDLREGFDGVKDEHHGGFFLARVNADGSYGWSRVIGDTTNSASRLHDLALDGKGSIYLAATFAYTVDLLESFGSGHDVRVTKGARDLLLMKIDTAGALGWAKVVGGGANDAASSVAVAPNGEIYVGVTSGSSSIDFGLGFDGASDIRSSPFDGSGFVIKLDSAGRYLWSRQFTGAGAIASVERVRTDREGNVYVLGMFGGDIEFRRDFGDTGDVRHAPWPNDLFLTRVNADGSYGWTQTFGGSSFDEVGDMAIDSAGRLHLCGVVSGPVDISANFGLPPQPNNDGGEDGFLISVTQRGWLLWAKYFGESREDGVFGLAPGRGDDLYFGGMFDGAADFRKPFDGVSDLRENSGTVFFLTHIIDDVAAVPRDRVIASRELTVSPNPASDEVVIRGEDLPREASTITVVDALGREVRRVDRGDGGADFRVSLRGLPAGIYAVRCASGDRVASALFVKR